VLVALGVLFTVRGSALGHELAINREMLSAQRNISRVESSEPCPNLNLTNSAALDATVNELDAAKDARSQQLEGLYYFAKDDWENATRVLDAAPHVTNVDSFWLGCAEYKSGDVTQAIVDWQHADAGDYFRTVAYQIHVTQGAWLALPYAQIATQIEPDSAAAWLELAQAELDRATQGKFSWTELLDSAERALSLAPQNPQAHYLVGFALWGSHGDLNRAEEELRLAWNATGQWLDGYVLAQVLLDEGKRGEPTVLMQKVLEQEDNANVRYLLVRAYVADGKCAEAMQAAEAARIKFPQFKINFGDFCKGGQGCGCGF